MSKLCMSHCIFPTPNIKKTAEYYCEKLGFREKDYLNIPEPHICLYRDDTEIILTDSNYKQVIPNRMLYGYGYDAYFITPDQKELQDELLTRGVKIVKTLRKTDYNNEEFVIEDVDGRWIAFGMKKK